jgi:rubrerythrin
VVQGGGGEDLRKNLLVFALFTLVLLVLAQSMSALTAVFKVPNKGGDGSDPEIQSDGGQAHICPHCGHPMKHCDPPSDVEWICHNCGYHIMR